MLPYYNEGGITIYLGDCREVLPTLSSESVDLVLTDPPYNVGQPYDQHNDRMAGSAYRGWLTGILAESSRVSRDGVVWTPGNVNVLHVPLVLDGSGLRVVRLLGWHRLEYAGDVWAGGPANAWEVVVWASKQPKPLFNRIYGKWGRDFLIVPSTRGNPWKKHHPCPKPNAVVDWLLGLFCPEGGTVLDPFAGSMTTLARARVRGQRAIGIEVSERYCELAATRFSQGVLFGAEVA